jgi:hypothetical protein
MTAACSAGSCRLRNKCGAGFCGIGTTLAPTGEIDFLILEKSPTIAPAMEWLNVFQRHAASALPKAVAQRARRYHGRRQAGVAGPARLYCARTPRRLCIKPRLR